MTTSSSNTNNTSNTAPPTLSNETLRERILTGGGTGAGRGSLAKAASRYAHFIHSLSSSSHDNDNSTTVATAAAALQTELLLHDLEIRKLILSSKASDGNSARYSATLSAMQTTLASTQHDIESLTVTLANERQIKHNREEYNALAKMGNDKSPPIRVTQLELEKVQKEIEDVKREVKEAQWEVNVRERQMRVFMQSLGDLKATLREEEIKKDNSDGGKEGRSSKGATTSPIQGKKRKHVSDSGNGSDDSNDNIGAL